MGTQFIQIEKITGNGKEIVSECNQSVKIQQIEYNNFMYLEAAEDLLILVRRI